MRAFMSWALFLEDYSMQSNTFATESPECSTGERPPESSLYGTWEGRKLENARKGRVVTK
jgi:hypothetical protein